MSGGGPPTVHVAVAGMADLARLWELFRDYHRAVAALSGEKPPPTEARFMEYWRPSGTRIALLARSAGESVGFCLLQELEEWPRGPGRCLELGAIHLLRDHRRGFNAARLWQAALDQASLRRLPLVTEISRDNRQSLALVQAFKRRRARGTSDFRVEVGTDDALRTRVLVLPAGWNRPGS